MGKKNDEEKSNSKNSKFSEPGKERLSVSTTLARMDRKLEKPKSKSSFNSKPKPTSYVDDLDLPPSDWEEDDGLENLEIDIQVRRVTRAVGILTNGFSLSVKEAKKRERKDVINTKKLEQSRQDALREDRDVFSVMIGSKTSAVDGEDIADANVKDITIENFSVSAKGKELLKNTSVKISHGKKYGLVGPNGKGKSTLLKLLAWRQVPVPKNIDVLLVEQEVVGDEKTVIEAVISGKKELMDIRREVERLRNGGGEQGEADNQGDRLVELYERLQIMSSDTAEVEAAKILRGLSFTKDMMMRQTKSFSGGGG